MSEQAETLLKIAQKTYKKLYKKVGVPIEGEPNETFLLSCSYSIEDCNWMGDHWDIPRYSNGSTRHTKCLFLIPPTYTGDGAYPYICDNNDTMEERFIGKDYDREKVLIKEYFSENLVEVIWSFDFGAPSSEGQYYYFMDKFWFGIRLNGELIDKKGSIKSLTIPDESVICSYCERVRNLLDMRYFNGHWICKGGERYEKCK